MTDYKTSDFSYKATNLFAMMKSMVVGKSETQFDDFLDDLKSYNNPDADYMFSIIKTVPNDKRESFFNGLIALLKEKEFSIIQ